MPSRRGRGQIKIIFPGEFSIYINNVDYTDNVLSYEFVEQQNEIGEFFVDLFSIGSAERTNVARGNDVQLRIAGALIFKGLIEQADYKTDEFCSVKGYGAVETILKNSVVEATTSADSTSTDGRPSYGVGSVSGVASNLIFDEQISGVAGVYIGTNDYLGHIVTRSDYDNTISFLDDTARNLSGVWWSSYGSYPFSTNFFNVGKRRGSGSSVKTFNVAGASQNANRTSREVDEEELWTSVVCYDDNTEVLTKSGFKLFKDISLDEKIATLDSNGFIKYHKPLALQKYRYSGEMYRIKTKFVDLKITPDHELHTILPHRGSKKVKWGGKQIREIYTNENYFVVKKDAKWKGRQDSYFRLPKFKENHHNCQTNFEKIQIEKWLKFMGWYLSEGCLHPNIKKGYKISIRQKKKDNLKEIYKLVKSIGWNAFYIQDGSVQFYSKQLYSYLKQFGKSGDKFVPCFIKNQSPENISTFLYTLFKGDGCIKNGKLLSYYSKSKRLIDDVQELLLKVGKASKVYFRKHGFGKEGCYELTVNHNSLVVWYRPHAWKGKIKKEWYGGFVYDATVPNHVIYVRRNGIASWQRNCLGQGDGTNQLKSRVYHATDNFTRLLSGCTADDTVLTVESTSGFPTNTFQAFEDWETGSIPATWTVTKTGTATVEVQDTEKKEGTYALHVTDTDDTASNWLTRPIKVGQEYSFWHKTIYPGTPLTFSYPLITVYITQGPVEVVGSNRIIKGISFGIDLSRFRLFGTTIPDTSGGFTLYPFTDTWYKMKLVFSNIGEDYLVSVLSGTTLVGSKTGSTPTGFSPDTLTIEVISNPAEFVNDYDCYIDTIDFEGLGLFVGSENVLYSGVTATTFNQCKRANVEKDFYGKRTYKKYAHSKDVAVFDASYSENNTDGNSQIDEYGLKQKVVTNKKITDQDTLDRAATDNLIAHYILTERIELEPTDIRDSLKNISVGDTVTAIDSGSDISGDYTIVGQRIRNNEGAEGLVYELENIKTSLTGDLRGAKAESKVSSQYMQGRTTVFNSNINMSGGSAEPANMRIWLPSDIIRVNNATLDYKLYVKGGNISGADVVVAVGKEGGTLENVTTGVLSSVSVSVTDWIQSGITLSDGNWMQVRLTPDETCFIDASLFVKCFVEAR